MAEGNFVPNGDGSWSMLTHLTGRKLKYQRQRVTTGTVITAGASSTINIYATPGYIARLKWVGAYMPAIAAATGNQSITIGIGSMSYGAEQINSTTGANGATVTVKYDSPSNISFDSVTPLMILFSNLTNLPTDGSLRMYNVIYEEEAITA